MQPPDIKFTWTADDGTVVTIRPIRPEDRHIEYRFVHNLSPRSSYLRFMAAVKDLSPKLLDRFTRVDYPREMALIATVESADGELEIGVARYAPAEADDTAEFAVVVADEWQGRGIGTELLRHLFEVARDAGLARIEGLVLRDNDNMLRLCRELGFEVGRYPGDASLALVGKCL